MMYAGGFWKGFFKEGTKIKVMVHPYASPVNAMGEVLEAEYPGFGNVILMKYEPPFDKIYDLVKIVDKDTILGKAFAIRNPPRGEHILTFSMSRRYGVDFMAQEDFKFIFFNKARVPEVNDLPGVWEVRLVSDSSQSPVVFRFRYYLKGGKLLVKYIFGGVLSLGTSEIRFTKALMSSFDFAGQAMKEELRLVRKDFMLGKQCYQDASLFKLLEQASNFLMEDGGKICLPYTMRRVA
jgi:hypothetical protein